MIRLSKLACVVAGALMVAGAPAIARAKGDVLVGAATSFSGWMAAFDTNATRAAEMAVDNINAHGGLLGQQLKFVHIDTKTDPAVTARAGQQLVADGVKVMIVACDFDNAAPAALVAQRANVLAISTCGADIKLGNMSIGADVFTMATDSAATGEMLADWAYKLKKWRTAYVLLDTFIQYDKSECRGFVQRFKKLAGDDAIVLEDQFKNSDVSVATQISRYQALPKKPDFMIICSVPPGLASAIREFRAAGVDIPIVSGTGGDGTAWYSAVPDLSNYYNLDYSANAGVTDPDPQAAAFLQAYKKRYGAVPDSGQGITGYWAVQAWADAVKKAGTFDTDKVRATLESFRDVPVLGGFVTFTKHLHTNVNRPMLIMQVTDGKGKALGFYDMRKGSYVKWW